MARTITVKGIGKVSARPDYVVISMSLESNHKDYDKAMSLAADNIQYLNETLGRCGFEKDAVKTTNFNVRTDYEREKDRYGNYKSVFCGYEVTCKSFLWHFQLLQIASPILRCPSPLL